MSRLAEGAKSPQLDLQPQPFPQPPPFPGPRKRSVNPLVAAASAAGAVAVLGVAAAATFYIQASDAEQTADDRGATITELRQQVSDATATDKRRAAALRAASEFSVQFSTYDVNDLDTYVNKVLDASTGSFKQDFANNSGAMRDGINFWQMRMHSLENNCGLTSLDGKKAQTVAIVKQSLTNIDTPDPNLPIVTTVTMLLTLEEQSDGSWKVSGMKAPAL
ncbi:hypothetical protein [Nocardia jejuensis]|uniref:hypothetical protein n=1 Tax=Nocardia jejuensis TaxID=328049 RepID=UPI000836E0D2|nr:hypothetical protein [Nocardia jejuensis]